MARAAETRRRRIEARRPGFGAVAFAGSWGGIPGFTRNEGAIFGPVRGGLRALMSRGAVPMTGGAIAGKLPAEPICGEGSALLQAMLPLPRAALLPPGPILRFIVNRKAERLAAAGTAERQATAARAAGPQVRQPPCVTAAGDVTECHVVSCSPCTGRIAHSRSRHEAIHAPLCLRGRSRTSNRSTAGSPIRLPRVRGRPGGGLLPGRRKWRA